MPNQQYNKKRCALADPKKTIVPTRLSGRKQALLCYSVVWNFLIFQRRVLSMVRLPIIFHLIQPLCFIIIRLIGGMSRKYLHVIQKFNEKIIIFK